MGYMLLLQDSFHDILASYRGVTCWTQSEEEPRRGTVYSRLIRRLNMLGYCDNLPWNEDMAAGNVRLRFEVAHEVAGRCLQFFAIE